MIKNKRGKEEGVSFFMLFLMMIIFITGIVAGVFAFFGEGIDFRDEVAESLFLKVEGCFSEKGESFFSEDFKISECGIAENVVDENYVIFIESLQNENKEFFLGEAVFRESCEFSDKIKENRKFPVCKEGEIVKDREMFRIVVGSNQDSRSVLSGRGQE